MITMVIMRYTGFIKMSHLKDLWIKRCVFLVIRHLLLVKFNHGGNNHTPK